MLNINQYFDGKVVSIGLQTESQTATVGVMDTGEYQFGTNQREVMNVVSGQLLVKLPNSDAWREVNTGESFEIAAEQVFNVKANTQTAYFCTYHDK